MSKTKAPQFVALIYDGGTRYYSKKFRGEAEFHVYLESRRGSWGHLYVMATGMHEVSVSIPRHVYNIPPRHPRQRKISEVGYVYPCKQCGSYPEWGAGFLVCSGGDHYETVDNSPLGVAVRDWNRENKPKKK
jgi:hypothetical protein